MATPAKLTPLQEMEARRLAEQAARANKGNRVYSEEEKAGRKERVAKAQLPADESKLLAEALEAGLTGYTYLSDEPLS